MSSEMEKLAAQLAEKRAAAAQSRAAAEQQFEAWVRSVAELYSQLNSWLEPLTNKGMVKTNQTNITINEEVCGTYQLPQMQLVFDGQTLALKPLGLYFIGSHGVVELTGGKRSVQITRHITNGEEQWQINHPIGGRNQPELLNEDSFARLLVQYVA